MRGAAAKIIDKVGVIASHRTARLGFAMYSIRYRLRYRGLKATIYRQILSHSAKLASSDMIFYLNLHNINCPTARC
jgi:hypothetical protein